MTAPREQGLSVSGAAYTNPAPESLQWKSLFPLHTHLTGTEGGRNSASITEVVFSLGKEMD